MSFLARGSIGNLIEGLGRLHPNHFPLSCLTASISVKRDTIGRARLECAADPDTCCMVLQALEGSPLVLYVTVAPRIVVGMPWMRSPRKRDLTSSSRQIRISFVYLRTNTAATLSRQAFAVNCISFFRAWMPYHGPTRLGG
jgi:hypothetical protein